MYFQVQGVKSYGAKTAAAGTAITRLFQPKRGFFTLLKKFLYTPGATSHTATVMKSLGRTTITAAAAAGATTVTLAANPGPSGNALATGDTVVIRLADGTFHISTITLASLTATLGTALPATSGANLGADVWMLGVVADHAADNQWALATGGQRTIDDTMSGVAQSNGMDEPLLLSIDNITNAGTLDQAFGGWATMFQGGAAMAPMHAENTVAAQDLLDPTDENALGNQGGQFKQGVDSDPYLPGQSPGGLDLNGKPANAPLVALAKAAKGKP
jgi:hypothetical protein